MTRESNFQSNLKKKIKDRIPEALIMKGQAGQIQGIPDLIILYKDRWAALECKKSAKESHRPNQDYYIQHMNEWSFAAFVYPENEEEVLDALQQALGA